MHGAAVAGQEGLFEPLTDRELAIYRKLGAESREDAALRARDDGLI